MGEGSTKLQGKVKDFPLSKPSKTVTQPLAYFESEERIARILYLFNIAIVAVAIVDTFVVFLNHDYNTAITLVILIPFVLLSLVFTRIGKIERASIYLAFYMIFVITLVSTQNLGIHHISNFAYAGILLVSSLVSKRRTMVLLTLAIIVGIAWLVFGELFGLYIPTVLNRSVPGDFLTASGIIVLIAIMARVISENMFRSNLELKNELVERKRIEKDLSENIEKQNTTEMLLRKTLEEKTDLLREKELLIKEVHHRVKNNMQVVSSLLNLQADNLNDPIITSILRDSQNRLHSLSLVHEQLYLSRSLSQIEAATYFRQLAESITDTYASSSDRIKFNFNLDSINLGIDQGIPCGLIMTELISNALKHGFPNERSGTITVSFVKAKESIINMAVEDDGVGIPLEKNWLQTGSLGMQLVTQLTEQLHGTLELTRMNQGSRFSIQFSHIS